MTAPISRLVLPLVALLALPLTGFAGQVTGIINGYNCTKADKTCPTDRTDPHLALEPDFVVLTSGGDYYLMPNVPRDSKVRHVLKEVKVTGDIDKQHQAINVDELKVKRDGGYETVWSEKWAMEERKRIYEETGTPGPGMAQ